MATPTPTLSLYLDGDTHFQLNRKALAGSPPTLRYLMHDKKNSVTLQLPGYDASSKTVSLPIALKAKLLELVDTTTNTQVDLPDTAAGTEASNASDTLDVPAGAPNTGLKIPVDPCDPLWTSALQNGRSYEIRWASGDDAYEPVCHAGEHNLSSSDPAHTHLPIRRLPDPIKLTVFPDAAAPPQFSLSLSPTAPICHLSGTSRFGFRLLITNNETYPITVWLARTPLRELHSLEQILSLCDADTDDEVEWPYGIGCFHTSGIDQDAFPDDEMFDTFEPGVPFERVFWLAPEKGEELDSLEAGRRYKGGVSGELLGAFGKWLRGTKEEVLGGEEGEKKERWEGAYEGGKIVWDVEGGEIEFETAE